MERDYNTATRRTTDETSTDSTTDTDATTDTVVSRRNVLKTTGALGALAVGGALSTGSAAAAPNADPETIEAPYEVVLGDGDVLANKRIVANGSDVSIVARGNDWEIRNVGIEGEAQSNPITVETSGGSGLIENVYVGGVSSSDEAPIFVHREHAGTITIRDANVGNTSNSHGIYASAPGSPPERKQGGGGAVQIESCYAHDTGGNGFRIGSDGSYVKDSVAANCDNSGVWNQWQEGRVENVAIEAGVNAFNVGANNYDNRNGECKLSVSNVEYDAPNEVRKAPGIGDWDYYSASGVTRTSSPDLSPPSGVPTSAPEAAGGGGGSSGGSSDSSSSSEPSEGSSDDESSDGTDSSGSDGSDESSESSGDENTDEEIEDESEETDSAGSDDSGSSDVTSADEDRSLEVEGTGDTSDGPHEYTLTVTGTITDLEGNPDDTVSDDATEVQGKVWAPFFDRYAFSGEIDSFETDGEVEVRVDGETVGPDSL